MYLKQNWKPLLAVTLGSIIVILACLSGGLPTSAATWAACLGAVLAQSSVLFFRAAKEADTLIHPDLAELEHRRAEFEAWQLARAEELQQQSHRLNERHRSLAEQSARFQEFSEYPVNEHVSLQDIDEEIRLSEQDRRVHELLEKEAELVYERIGRNEYTLDGTFNVAKVREDALNLVRQVAKIYSPGSNNPLLETSFEQLARAASRICLHSLVLLEQLPLDVKSYNVNEMYGYVRKAVQGYGAYKQAAPWIKHLSRGAYFGRFAAGANPVSLGAWWLATEVGRRGAQKVVENIVDRQTVAVLHDIVTVVGVEAANIYGPGFRQRDPAWVYGTELTELLKRFPMSRESLSRGLQQITQLPLRSEYDRIYLYRCLAGKKAAGTRLSDPSVLTRKDRESIAAQLENFFHSHLHGVNEQDRLTWQEDVESRLDMKLKLGASQGEGSVESQAECAIVAVHGFLTSVAAVSATEATSILEHSVLMTHVPFEQRDNLLKALNMRAGEDRFEPPNLDPDAEMTDLFLTCLSDSCIISKQTSVNIVALLLETAAYFRRSQQDGRAILDAAFSRCLDQRKTADCRIGRIEPAMAQLIMQQLNDYERLSGGYGGVSQLVGNVLNELPDSLLIVIIGSKKSASDTACNTHDSAIRSVLLTMDSASPVWTSTPDVVVKRRKGYLIDDCEIQGGQWSDADNSTSMVLAGSVTGGGFRKTFAPLIQAFAEKSAE